MTNKDIESINNEYKDYITKYCRNGTWHVLPFCIWLKYVKKVKMSEYRKATNEEKEMEDGNV